MSKATKKAVKKEVKKADKVVAKLKMPKGLVEALQLEDGKIKAKFARSKSQRQQLATGVGAGPGMVCVSGIVFSTSNHHAMPYELATQMGYKRVPVMHKTCNSSSKGFKRTSKPDLASCLKQCSGTCKYVTYNTEKDCDTSITCQMIPHPRAATALPRIFKKLKKKSRRKVTKAKGKSAKSSQKAKKTAKKIKRKQQAELSARRRRSRNSAPKRVPKKQPKSKGKKGKGA